MLSVIIPTHNDEAGLARMLGHLVPHAVSGLITEVIVYDDGSTDRTAKVCDVAGAALVDAANVQAKDLISRAKGQGLLILPPGAHLGVGWSDAVEAHLNAPTGAGAARFRLAANHAVPWWQRAFRPLKAKGPFGRGVLVPKTMALAAIGEGATLEAIIRGRALRTLPAEITP